ncbi:hypothetical protein PN478_08885 [Dolichospermum circinale CS-534/05]|uniref:hypothetical protein n=1 Tax=Aphanizomenonaceae TaxID=1892259 RepID=UPI00232F5D14|nr:MULTISPECIES: hypothetical protein [Aphanizomenonaceae]MDB9311144.1 hypothetical protein [Aphanizomenon sp. CS-733/32]MDB9490635.1 hypothetical protein [Dolichospermum circinale CS-534/05]
MSKTLLALIVAAATNCPLVNIAGDYTLDLRTETATAWNDSPSLGCRSTGSISGLKIQPDGLMTGHPRYSLLWVNPGGGMYHTEGSVFGGRVEPGSEPMQWTGSVRDVEITGTLRRGQLSGTFVRRLVIDGKQIECRGKVSGFKKGK